MKLDYACNEIARMRVLISAQEREIEMLRRVGVRMRAKSPFSVTIGSSLLPGALSALLHAVAS